MDDEIRGEFRQVRQDIGELTVMMEKHVSYEEGLDLPNRVTKAERDIEDKPSWAGISGILTGFSVILGMVFLVVKGV